MNVYHLARRTVSGMANPKTSRTERRQAELARRREDQKRAKIRQKGEAETAASLDDAASRLAPRTTWFTALFAAVLVFLAVGPLGVFSSAYPVAGDQVTHNWWLVEFRDRLFAFDGVFGWTNDLSLGYMFGFFYFPLPPLVFSAISLVFADAVAIKIMVALSLVLLPVAALRLARGLGFSAATLPLVPLLYLAALFSNQPQFVGGTLYSTLTGEFSYAYGLAFAMFAIAEALMATRAVRGAWWRTGMFLGLALLSHILAALPALLFACYVYGTKLWYRSRSTAVASVLVAVSIAAWWLVPSVFSASEALGDGHNRVTDLFGWIFPWRDALPLVLAGLSGLAYGLFRRRPGARLLALLAAAGPMVLLVMPGSFMWNVRIMPWYYASLALAVAYLFEPLTLWLRKKAPVFLRALPAGALLAGLSLGLAVPDNFSLARSIRDSQYGGASLSGTRYVDELTEYLKTLPPGRAMVALPKEWAGALPARDWVTALPMHTDGRITSAISLYYEASKTTPGIEYVHSHVSEIAHTSLSWFGYADLDDDVERTFAVGVRGMRLLGIRYYIVGDQKMFNLASASPDLVAIKAVGESSKALGDGKGGLPAHQWGVFELRDTTLVEGITTPVGVQDPPFSSERDWASASAKWLATYDLRGDAPYLVEEGPELFDARTANPPITVSDVALDERTISFSVDKVGTPVLVKVSHSSHWRATGAAGPYRAAPNLMVVIPTEQRVVLEYTNPVWTKIGPLTSVAALAAFTALLLSKKRRNNEARS